MIVQDLDIALAEFHVEGDLLDNFLIEIERFDMAERCVVCSIWNACSERSSSLPMTRCIVLAPDCSMPTCACRVYRSS